MTLAYTLSGSSSNDAYFFDMNTPSNILCPQCGSCLNYEYFPPSLEIKPSKKYDVSYTNDLRKIYSEKFVEYCKNILGSDDTFSPIQTPWGMHYYMFPKRMVVFDRFKRETEFNGACSVCDGYEEVVGASPAFLLLDSPLDSGFYRTDLAFGSKKSKFPLILVSPEWRRALESQKFRGIVFHAVS